MRAIRIVANLRVPHVDAAKSFYTDYLGLSTEEFNMRWVACYTSPDAVANVQLVTRDATAPEDSVISVQTDDVDGANKEARELGYKIVRPITPEPGGCAGSSSAHQTATSSTSRDIETDSGAACVTQADRRARREVRSVLKLLA